MGAKGWLPLVVGLLASAIALLGYLMNQAASRRERKAKLFAEALEAVKALEEMPFRIARRPASDGPTRAAIGGQLSDLFVRLGFYRAWTQIEAPRVGEAYVILLDQTQREVRPLRKAAWAADLLGVDAEAYLDGTYPVLDNKREWSLCLAIMQMELRPLVILRRRRMARMTTEFRRRPMDFGFSMSVDWRESGGSEGG